jgi:multiple antibiotic resistance protein
VQIVKETHVVLPFLVKAFLTLLVVIDPVGLSPIFITLAGERPVIEQYLIARQAILVAGGILLVFALVGSALLHHLGISLEAFQVAAGILLFKIAVDMVFAQRERETADEARECQHRKDISVFPLAIPLIAGPGTLASVMILAGEAKSYPLGLMAVLAITAAVLALAYISLCLSRSLARLLGQIGVNVVSRVLGVLLAALAVQYIANGITVLLKSAFNLSS